MSASSLIIVILMSIPAGYGLFAMIFTLVRRLKMKAFFRAGGVPQQDILYNPKYFKFIEGKSGAQLTSFVLHLILLVGVLFCFATFNSGGFLLYGFALFILTPATIAANAIWIYPVKNIQAEQYALFTKKASNFLKAELIVAWVTWAIYEAAALYMIGAVIINFASVISMDGFTG